MFYFFLSLIIRFLSILYQSVLFLKPSQYYHINVNSSIIIWYSSRLMRCFFPFLNCCCVFFSSFRYECHLLLWKQLFSSSGFLHFGWQFCFCTPVFFYYDYAWCHIFMNTFLCDLLFHFGSRNTLFFSKYMRMVMMLKKLETMENNRTKRFCDQFPNKKVVTKLFFTFCYWEFDE